MRKFWTVFVREYTSRVFTPLFLLTTLGTPILFGALMVIPILVTQGTDDGAYTVYVQHELPLASRLPALSKTDELTFVVVKGSKTELEQRVRENKNTIGIYAMGDTDLKRPSVTYYTHQNPGAATLGRLHTTLRDLYRSEKLIAAGVPRDQLEDTKVEVSFSATQLTEKGEQEGSLALGYAVGYGMAILNYLLLIIYGVMVMRGVMEEKINRIVEVIVSSVRPQQLMLGKVLGIGAVGLTQFFIWALLFAGIMLIVGLLMATTGSTPDMSAPEMQATMEQSKSQAHIIEQAMGKFTFGLMSLFVFYFITGYLLYGSLFAAVGSAADQESDTQQLSPIVMIPIVLPMLLLGAILNNPNGPLAFWMSMIPFFSPIVMMVRYASSDVPTWQLLLSMALMVGGVYGTIQLSARIYRVGIFMYGKRPNLKELWKWLWIKA